MVHVTDVKKITLMEQVADDYGCWWVQVYLTRWGLFLWDRMARNSRHSVNFKGFQLPLVANSLIVIETRSFPMVGVVNGSEMYKV